jgi:hypothetical protein
VEAAALAPGLGSGLGLSSCGWRESQARIEVRSYEWPSVHVTGSHIRSLVIGQRKDDGGSTSVVIGECRASNLASTVLMKELGVRGKQA